MTWGTFLSGLTAAAGALVYLVSGVDDTQTGEIVGGAMIAVGLLWHIWARNQRMKASRGN